MITKLTRRSVLSTIAAASMLAGTTATTVAADQMTFTLATAGSETDMRSVSNLELVESLQVLKRRLGHLRDDQMGLRGLSLIHI